MKKILLSAIGVGLLSLASCSSEEAPKPTPTEGQQVLTIRVDDATRRVIDSSAGGNDVQDIIVFFYKKIEDTNGDYFELVNSKLLSDWEEKTVTNGTYSLPLFDEDKLSNGNTYLIKAIAFENGENYKYTYSDGSNYQTKNINHIPVDEYGSDDPFYYLSDFDVPEYAYSGSSKADELFAGETVEFVAAANSNPVLTLKRQVAGAFVYVKDIPYVAAMNDVDAEGNPVSVTLDLVASAPLNKSLVLGEFSADNVVNGCTPSENYTILSIDLREWFNAFELDSEGDGQSLKAGANWEGNDTKYTAGSVFGSTFLIPQAAVSGQNTLTLQLCVNGVPTRHKWVLLLAAADLVTDASDILKWYKNTSFGGTSSFVNGIGETRNSYNLLRDHLYTIGVRTSSDLSVEGSNAPQSLFVPVQELSVSFANDWSSVNNTTIE